ncbi:NAD(P)-dependent oxidoreductase [Paraburkholderia caballeronis]|uniref:3-hydroxyisobutyrate dehydrogenase n=1 Tax=Paraburkholderia caballeronis TaxID=416943 RepID=A0A1H7P0D0_9BURK|nr:NAD(P)-dependent oxidoreductase [Paraburkholderia caballeronis]PXW25439.1 3-hydroxyisobutyrate dehydrogenase-like beta-hydroxyacid dehydrogenase [Paraburkholderia caballeronis]PXX01046.1 3-hydroxyisobutyrate dehydrogenase-like beta-hydroxyacid dehydrogenase [Paraburkholderia caballeronis]RAJ99601.1 3-hydroxyisobutyrate dehydrogenase-like beta-hydroxyacid dehydrogenase [Paraburkholderia caballeronis]SEE37318.1 3-hydroxyisobutyrate dehydrogenase [Paraburkholderia caballeronis]SEL29330.1 3-hyd
MSTTMRIGFCGLGKMGLPMARRLIDAGHRVAVWNRTHEKARALGVASALCIACETPEEVARESDVVLLCLADGVAVEDVAFGPRGLAMGARRKALTIVDHSTLAPSQTRSLAARWRDATQGEWIDAPVSGGTAGASHGTLAIMAGGDAACIESVEPVLAAFAARVTRMGDSGAGQATKLVNQTITMTTIAALAEATNLARHAGIDASKMSAALAGGWADSVLLQTVQPRMVVPPGQPTGSIRTMLKDLDAVASLAGECGVALPIAARVRDWLARAVDEGFGDEDISQIVRV